LDLFAALIGKTARMNGRRRGQVLLLALGHSPEVR
jgi:hypothetical protein